MDQNLITAMAAVLGSLSGASAAVATTWISQKSQTIRERAKSEMRKRETLYGDFITEASQQLANAFDHSLDKPETLVKLYGILGRIRLVSSDAVLTAAEECCDRIVDLYVNQTGQSTSSSRRYTVASSNFSSASATPAASSFADIPLINCRRFAPKDVIGIHVQGWSWRQV